MLARQNRTRAARDLSFYALFDQSDQPVDPKGLIQDGGFEVNAADRIELKKLTLNLYSSHSSVKNWVQLLQSHQQSFEVADRHQHALMV